MLRYWPTLKFVNPMRQGEKKKAPFCTRVGTHIGDNMIITTPWLGPPKNINDTLLSRSRSWLIWCILIDVEFFRGDSHVFKWSPHVFNSKSFNSGSRKKEKVNHMFSQTRSLSVRKDSSIVAGGVRILPGFECFIFYMRLVDEAFNLEIPS